jgi:hypothetical protein
MRQPTSLLREHSESPLHHSVKVLDARAVVIQILIRRDQVQGQPAARGAHVLDYSVGKLSLDRPVASVVQRSETPGLETTVSALRNVLKPLKGAVRVFSGEAVTRNGWVGNSGGVNCEKI